MTSSALLKHLFAAVVALVSLVVLTGATQVMQRPVNFKSPPPKYTTVRVTPQIVHKRASGKIQAGYFTNWLVILVLRHLNLIRACFNIGGLQGNLWRKLPLVHVLVKSDSAPHACLEPTDIIPSELSHILYAFADVTPSTGAIFLTDTYADEQVRFDSLYDFYPEPDFCVAKKHFPGDSWDEPGNNLYGCLKQVLHAL